MNQGDGPRETGPARHMGTPRRRWMVPTPRDPSLPVLPGVDQCHPRRANSRHTRVVSHESRHAGSLDGQTCHRRCEGPHQHPLTTVASVSARTDCRRLPGGPSLNWPPYSVTQSHRQRSSHRLGFPHCLRLHRRQLPYLFRRRDHIQGCHRSPHPHVHLRQHPHLHPHRGQLIRVQPPCHFRGWSRCHIRG